MKQLLKKCLPTRKEFAAMAARGRLWHHDEPSPCTPTPEMLKQARTPIDYGRAYGYSEDDIAHFYNFRRRGHAMAYDEYRHDLERSTPSKPDSCEKSGPRQR
jgi:hypothetical protein